MAVVPQQPPRAGGRPPLPVVVHHHGPVAAHTGAPHGRLEPCRVGQRVPAAGARRVGEVLVEVDVRRSGDVARLVLLAAGRAALR